jgi:hypothetical protein
MKLASIYNGSNIVLNFAAIEAKSALKALDVILTCC